ncbi:MAG: VOC family protein [Halioglobus sp.]|nr:VOC family protein [Halioglobus sp.]
MHTLHHIAIVCSDLERSRAFYEEVFEMTVLVDYGATQPYDKRDRLLALKNVASRAMLLGNDCLRIELIEFAEPKDDSGSPPAINRVGFSHIAVQTEDIAGDYARLIRMGVPCNSEPIDFGKVTALYARDPDGNTIEWLQMQ